MKPRALYVALFGFLATLGVPHAAAAQGELLFTTGGEPRCFGGPTIPGQINRVKVDGTELTVLIADTQAASGAGRPYGIAVDVVWGRIYYTHWRLFPGLHFVDLDGGNTGSIAIDAGFFTPVSRSTTRLENSTRRAETASKLQMWTAQVFKCSPALSNVAKLSWI